MYSLTRHLFEQKPSHGNTLLPCLGLCGKKTKAKQTAVHQIAHRLIVDAHDAADVIILALLHIIEGDDLLLAWRQAFQKSHNGIDLTAFIFHALQVENFGILQQLGVGQI